jgi:osmotically-inducible protein OsmY
LRGEAVSPAQRDLTGEYAKGVDGVKGVDNEIKVVPAVKQQKGKTMRQKPSMESNPRSIRPPPVRLRTITGAS